MRGTFDNANYTLSSSVNVYDRPPSRHPAILSNNPLFQINTLSKKLIGLVQIVGSPSASLNIFSIVIWYVIMYEKYTINEVENAKAQS
jgi:hypothetical protein